MPFEGSCFKNPLENQDDEARSEDPAPSSCSGWSLLVAWDIKHI